MDTRSALAGAVAGGAMVAMIGLLRAPVARSLSESGGGTTLRSAPGETAAGGRGRTGDVAPGSSDEAESAPLTRANENLVEQVRDARRRLETLAAEKAAVEASLKAAEEKLAARSDGGRRNEFDPTKEDWADLARNGQVNWRTPCYDKDEWLPSAEALQKLGLAPGDGGAIREASERSYQRLWSQIRPICAEELGQPKPDVLERIGPDACVHLVYDLEVARDKKAALDAHTAVAEIRAGLRPEPGPNEPQHPVLRLFLLLTRANGAFEADLAKTFGPDEAHRLAFADELCHDQKRVKGGAKRP